MQEGSLRRNWRAQRSIWNIFCVSQSQLLSYTELRTRQKENPSSKWSKSKHWPQALNAKQAAGLKWIPIKKEKSRDLHSFTDILSPFRILDSKLHRKDFFLFIRLLQSLSLADHLPFSKPHAIPTQSEENVFHDALSYLYELLFSAKKIIGPTNTMSHSSWRGPCSEISVLSSRSAG